MLGAITPDLQQTIENKQSLVAATRTATANGTGVDALDHEQELFAVLDVGTVSGTSPTLDVSIEESDDNTSFAALAVVNNFAQVTAGNNAQTRRVQRAKRYVRAVATIAGSSPSFACAVQFLCPKKSAN